MSDRLSEYHPGQYSIDRLVHNTAANRWDIVLEGAKKLGMETLVEIHSHHQTQIAITSSPGGVYDFALPPLVLHTFYIGNSDALKQCLAISPRNCVTVLDTHDGIGIRDVARQGGSSGSLS